MTLTLPQSFRAADRQRKRLERKHPTRCYVVRFNSILQAYVVHDNGPKGGR